MLTKLKALLEQNDLTDLAKKARFQPKTILQLLLFAAVFMIGNAVNGFIIGVPTGIIAAKKTFEFLNQTEYVNVFSLVMDITQSMYELIWFKALSLFGTVFTTAAAIIFCTRLEKRSAASMGFHKKNSVKKYLLGYVIGVIMLAVTCLLNRLFGGIRFTVSDGIFKMLPILLLMFAGYMLQGMSEEVLVRGYLQMTLSIHKKQWFAVLSSAFVFAALHLFNPGISVLAFFNIFLFGVLMSLLLLRTNSIWFVSALHAAWNFAQGHLFGISVSGTGMNKETLLQSTFAAGKKLINGGDFGIEGGICTTIVLVIAIAAVILSVKSKEEPVTAQEENTVTAESIG